MVIRSLVVTVPHRERSDRRALQRFESPVGPRTLRTSTALTAGLPAGRAISPIASTLMHPEAQSDTAAKGAKMYSAAATPGEAGTRATAQFLGRHARDRAAAWHM
jgi:hypothetical protein